MIIESVRREKRRPASSLWDIALTVALGGFLVGFDATVISGVVPFIRDYFHLQGSSGSLQLGWAVSSLGWGAMAGNLAAGFLNDRFGRRRVMLLTALTFLLSSLSAAFSTRFAIFTLSRVLGGMSVGVALLTAPMYIAEIAPADRRGRLVSVNQLMIVAGISVSFFSNYFLLSMGAEAWRWMIGVQALPALLYFVLLYRVPESPRWLIARGRGVEALRVLGGLRGPADAPREYELIVAHLGRGHARVGRVELLAPRLRGMLLFGFGIAFFQQATGINAVFYYLPTIFSAAGGELSSAFGQSVVVGLVNVVMTLLAIKLIDRLGRRPLLCIGVAGMAVALLTISWAFHRGAASVSGATGAHGMLVLAALIGYVASFAISLGPVMWVLLSEIFPNDERAAAIAVVGFWNSLVSATVTLLFPTAIAAWGPSGTFLVYGLLAVAGFAFLVLRAPETRNRTLEELENLLTRRLHGGET